jgi:hypothetical protein
MLCFNISDSIGMVLSVGRESSSMTLANCVLLLSLVLNLNTFSQVRLYDQEARNKSNSFAIVGSVLLSLSFNILKL